MPLNEHRRFNRADARVAVGAVANAVASHGDELNRGEWLYCGYASLMPVVGVNPPAVHVHTCVDNELRLSVEHGFERFAAVVTTGLRTSRFASVLYWEVLHVLAAGGLWIDVDETSRCQGAVFGGEDFFEREYYRDCLCVESCTSHDGISTITLRKHAQSPLALHIEDDGWTFGILTSRDSSAAAEMASRILALDLPSVEVIFCGPRPSTAPDDPRVRVIDLDQPEPRGWISRKKNLLAEAARYENLCMLHDRFVVTPEWAGALRSYGSCFSFVTFPQVWFADHDRHLPIRYADYQVLHQRQGVLAALDSNVYAGERVFYLGYDDFADTAFCCGGLYLAKRSLWNRVRQDESLFHAEWEDVSFGLECQRRGLPHRVNRMLTVESMTPHPMALTRIHDMSCPDQAEPGKLHITPEHAAAAEGRRSTRFKPVFPFSRQEYYRRVIERFNRVPGVGPDVCIELDESTIDCHGIADFWRSVERHVLQLPFTSQDDLAEVAFFLADTIYPWPNCEVQEAIRANERARTLSNALASYSVIVGWGTGSLFRAVQPALGRTLAFVVNRDAAKWGSVINGIEVRPPAALYELEPCTTAVVVFSCSFEDIALEIRGRGGFSLFRAEELITDRFVPLSSWIKQAEEIERYYPTLFSEGD